MTAPNGDALFLTFGGVIRYGASPGVNTAEIVFTITGGSGRFQGASGTGTFKDVVDTNKGTFTRTVEGAVVLPG
jgi:hypothetical protein